MPRYVNFRFSDYWVEITYQNVPYCFPNPHFHNCITTYDMKFPVKDLEKVTNLNLCSDMIDLGVFHLKE